LKGWISDELTGNPFSRNQHVKKDNRVYMETALISLLCTRAKPHPSIMDRLE